MKRRGLTLPEVLVACSLAALVLTGLTVLFVQAVRWHRGLETALELQESNLAGLAALSRDLSESHVASLRLRDGGAVQMASPRRPDGTLLADSQGRLLWHKWVLYSVVPVDGVPCLVRQELALAAPQDTAPIPAEGDNPAGAPIRVVARNVELLEATVGTTVTLRLVSRLVRGGELYRIDSRSEVLPKS